jgi:hypothetical protein
MQVTVTNSQDRLTPKNDHTVTETPHVIRDMN